MLRRGLRLPLGFACFGLRHMRQRGCLAHHSVRPDNWPAVLCGTATVTCVRMTETAKGFWGLLTGAERGDLSAAGRTRVYEPGEIMCNEGDLATHLFVLVTGRVKIIFVTADGHRRVVALRGNGDVIGELAGETGGERTATVQAIEAVQALIVVMKGSARSLDLIPGPLALT